MSFFRQYIAPLAVLIIFLLALFAVSIRIFLPSDMAAPAPVSLNDLGRDRVTTVAVVNRFEDRYLNTIPCQQSIA